MEILPGVHRVANAVSTAYLLIDDREGVTVIDCGPPGFAKTLLTYLQKIGRQPAEVRRIILTHRHVDHIGGAQRLRAATNARVFAHDLDAPQISGAVPYRYPSGPMGISMRLIFRLMPCPVDASLLPGQSIFLGGLGELQVVFTPGHTFGHCSLVLPSRRLAILGDALGRFGKEPAVPPAFLNDDDVQAQATGRQLADQLEADVLVFGHGAPILHDGQAILRGLADRLSAAGRR